MLCVCVCVCVCCLDCFILLPRFLKDRSFVSANTAAAVTSSCTYKGSNLKNKKGECKSQKKMGL